jgi:hypothetical protein
MQNGIQVHPEQGTNLVFHNGNHTMLLGLNDDGTVDVAHNSSNPGHSETMSYPSVQAFEDDWSPYGSIQYVPLGDHIQAGGKND